MSTAPHKGDLMAMLADLERSLAPSVPSNHSEDRPIAEARPTAADRATVEARPVAEDRPLAEIVRIIGERQNQQNSAPPSRAPAVEPPLRAAEPSRLAEPRGEEKFAKADFAALRDESLRLGGDEKRQSQKRESNGPGLEPVAEVRRPWRPALAAAAVVVALGGLAAAYVLTGEAPDSTEVALTSAEAELATSASEAARDANLPTEEASLAQPSQESASLASVDGAPPATTAARAEENAPTPDSPNSALSGEATSPPALSPPAAMLQGAAPQKAKHPSPSASLEASRAPVDAPPPSKPSIASSRPTASSAETPPPIKPAPKPAGHGRTAERGQQKPASAARAKVIPSPAEARRAPAVEDVAEAPPPPPTLPASNGNGAFGFVKRATDSLTRVVTDIGRTATGLIP